MSLLVGTRHALLSPPGGLNSPADIPGLVADFIADSLLALADAAAVTAFPELVSGNSADQAVGANQPTIRKALAAFNGHDAILFDGTNDVLVDTTPTNMALGVAFTLAVVFRRGAAGVTQDLISVGNSTGGRGFRILNTNLLNISKPGTGSASGNTAITDTVGAHVAVVTYDGTTAKFWLDALADGTPAFNAGGSFTDGDLVLGARNSAATEPWNGHAARWTIYNRTLTAAQVVTLSRWLGKTYGIVVA